MCRPFEASPDAVGESERADNDRASNGYDMLLRGQCGEDHLAELHVQHAQIEWVGDAASRQHKLGW